MTTARMETESLPRDMRGGFSTKPSPAEMIICKIVMQMHNQVMRTIPFSEPIFTYSEALTASGAENGWLRTMLQRDREGRIGERHRTGRLLFSMKDIVAIALLHRLNVGLRIAPSAAWEVLDAAYAVIATKRGNIGDVDIRFAFNKNSQVMVWTRNGDAIKTWNDIADANQLDAFMANSDVHIVVPMKGIMLPAAKAAEIAKSWPEEDR